MARAETTTLTVNEQAGVPCFWSNLQHAEKHDGHMKSRCVFEACVPIEELASRGAHTMRFGPMRPVA